MLSKTALSLLHERMKTPQHIPFGSSSLGVFESWNDSMYNFFLISFYFYRHKLERCPHARNHRNLWWSRKWENTTLFIHSCSGKTTDWSEEFSDFLICCSQFWIEEKNLLSTMLQYYHVEKGYFQLSDYPNLL